ncbi:MAG TPA: EAL domain-containing protein [Candidatus Baltobacteraceae bacterium]|nr:EAL domain-containing protein [Candidatus Baltobacteraceae bacterium]
MRLRVLCVDDSPDDTDLNVLALERHGYTVERVRVDRSEDAQAALNEQSWDLILCDYSMPNFSAPAMLALLRARDTHTPCLVVSGAIGEEAAVETIRLGAYDYIFKNNLKRLGPAAERALRDAELRRARALMEVQLRERETRLRLLFEQLPALVISCDTSLTVTSVEGAQLAQVPDDPGTLIGTHVAGSALLADESRFPIRHAHLQALQGGAAEYEMIWGGKTFRGHVEPLRDVDARIVGTIAVAFDITERKIAEQRIQYFAQYDPLTDLPNRALLEDRLTQAIAMAQRHRGLISLITVDIDSFGEVNELYGTANGDEVLRLVSARIRRLVDASATVSRVGEDQFVLLLVDVPSADEAKAFLGRLHGIFDSPFIAGDVEVYLRASSGCAFFPDDGHDAQTLLRASEASMHAAKQSGGHAWRLFVPSMIAASSERLSLKRDLRSAAANGEYVVYYQPIFRATDLRFGGFEALVRWQHPQMGLLPPDHFIPLAEETGAIDDLGSYVLHNVCRQIAMWDEAGMEVPRVCVNISARQFERPGLKETIALALGETGIDAPRLELELTESSIMRDITGGIAMLHELKAIGVRLSVDDFGTGYTSLSYLRRFPIDVLKIDKSFLRDMLPGSQDEAIVKAIVMLAENLGLTSIAEGIESRVTLEQVRAIGAYEVQGYFLGEPSPSEEALLFISDLQAARRVRS